jgi:tripartite-type tricarboxylate transporter receptor subunit TctC
MWTKDYTSGRNKTQAENKTEKFPTKPITLIVPYDAGGGSDLTSRMVASIAEKELGVPVTIVNMPGGSRGNRLRRIKEQTG